MCSPATNKETTKSHFGASLLFDNNFPVPLHFEIVHSHPAVASFLFLVTHIMTHSQKHGFVRMVLLDMAIRFLQPKFLQPVRNTAQNNVEHEHYLQTAIKPAAISDAISRSNRKCYNQEVVQMVQVLYPMQGSSTL